MLAWVLATAPAEAERLRLALLGLGFRAETGEPLAVDVAGDPAAAELWIAGEAGAPEEAPPRLARLTLGGSADAAADEAAAGGAVDAAEAAADGAGPLTGPLLLEVFAEGAHGLVGVSAPGEPLRPFPSLPLEDGDLLRFGGRSWRVDLPLLGPPALVDEAGGLRVELPRRTGELPVIGLAIPILRPHPATRATYPLAWATAAARTAGTAATTDESRDDTPGGGTAPAAPPAIQADAEDTGAFLFFAPDPLLGGDLRLSAPPGEVEVERGGQPLPLPTRMALAPGQRLHLLSPPLWDGTEPAASGVRDRRSYRVEAGERSLALLYDTPEVHSLSAETVAELAEPEEELGVGGPEGAAADGAAAAPRVGLSFGDWQVTDRSLYLRHAPAAVAAEAVASLELPAGDDDAFSAATPRGSRSGRFGEPLWLGGDHLAAVQLDRLRPPRWLGLVALVLALWKALAARAARLPLAGAAWAAALEGLIALRLVLGYRAFALPPARVEALELAAVAWLLVPFAFLVAALPVPSVRSGGWWRAGLPALAGWALSLAWSLRVGARPAVWVAVHLAVLAVPAVRWLLVSRSGMWHTTGGGLGRRGEAWRERWLGRGGLLADPRRQRLAWAAAPFLVTLLRGGLLLVGLRESVTVGGTRVALSLVHLPLALAIAAGYLVWLRRRAEAAEGVVPSDLGPALSMALGLWLLPAVLVSDLGLALLQLPVLLVGLVWVTAAAGVFRRDGLAPDEAPRKAARGRLTVRRLARPLARWAPVAALVAILAVQAAPAAAKAAVSLVPDDWRLALESERNYLRVLAFAYPQELARVARRESEELAVMAAVMDRYTAGPALGRGWFSSEVSPHLRATALREHAVAVFVAAEQGVVGSLGLLLLYAAAALAVVPLAPWRGPLRVAAGAATSAAFARGLGVLAGLSFALPSAYMVLANYQLTLFTGKNAYLLGLDSTADLLEALLLSTLVAVAVAVAGDREAR